MRHSNISVEPLDLTKVRSDAIQFANQTSEIKINQVRSVDLGIIQTADGIYCLSRDGIGIKDPITDEQRLILDLWGERVVTDDFGRPVVFGPQEPQWHVSLGSNELLQLRTGEKENLGTFISKSEQYHQENFNEWNDFIDLKFHWDFGEVKLKESQ